MLVLSRKRGECITIGDEIVVTVLEVRGRHIRLGFDAPKDVQIRRDNASSVARGPTEEVEAAEPASV